MNTDDCWQVSRAADGTIQADPIAFPSGMPALIDYIHSKGLKFGLYTGRIFSIYLVDQLMLNSRSRKFNV